MRQGQRAEAGTWISAGRQGKMDLRMQTGREGDREAGREGGPRHARVGRREGCRVGGRESLEAGTHILIKLAEREGFG